LTEKINVFQYFCFHIVAILDKMRYNDIISIYTLANMFRQFDREKGKNQGNTFFSTGILKSSMEAL